jgi:hypothetical protein
MVDLAGGRGGLFFELDAAISDESRISGRLRVGNKDGILPLTLPSGTGIVRGISCESVHGFRAGITSQISCIVLQGLDRVRRGI